MGGVGGYSAGEGRLNPVARACGAGCPDRRGVARRAGWVGRARGRGAGTEGAGPERSPSGSPSLEGCAQTARRNWGAGDCAVSAPLPCMGAQGAAPGTRTLGF